MSTGNETWKDIAFEVPQGEKYQENILFERNFNERKLKPGKYKISKTFDLDKSKKTLVKNIYFIIK